MSHKEHVFMKCLKGTTDLEHHVFAFPLECVCVFELPYFTLSLSQSSFPFSSSRNNLESLPDWLVEAKRLEVLDVSHNLVTELPAR